MPSAKHTPITAVIQVLLLAITLSHAHLTLAQVEDGIDEEGQRQAHFERVEADIQAGMDAPVLPAMGAAPCTGGYAGPYQCHRIDLLAFIPLFKFGGGTASDVWGWTDPLDGREYALLGLSTGTVFVDISDPEIPVYIGNLPAHSSSSSWRDIKTYRDHAFIVSEAVSHGMQVFDLTRLRQASPPETFTEDAHFSGFSSAHNIAVNEDSGYAYVVGANTCSGGLHMIDIRNPSAPEDAGCFSADGYTHDAQCVLYSGPDLDYQGAEVCFAYNPDNKEHTDRLTIVDVTDKGSPALISRSAYIGSGYTHQGWVTADQAYLLMNDELDEINEGHTTRTRIWDIADLDNPSLLGYFDGVNPSIDHNLYIQGGYAYESNYTSGLQIMDLASIGSGSLKMVAFFDTYTPDNSASFNGSWSNYPFFSSGVVAVSGINEGLFLLRPLLGESALYYFPVMFANP